MSIYRYILEPYKGMNSRFHCPYCKVKEKTFTRYIDLETGEYLNPNVGRCNRESSCGYHYTPKQFFQENNISNEKDHGAQRKRKPEPKMPTSYISTEIMEASLRGYGQNNLVKFLISLFGEDVTVDALKKYLVGTSKHWPGSTVFWQIDTIEKIRTGKIMLYDATTGKRVKDPFNHITWVHSVLKQPEFELKQCLFGEHLLKISTLPVAVVESEKTALIASIYLPQFTWLATGGLSNLTSEKLFVLKGRTVILFPDVNGYDKWTVRANEISALMPGTRFVVSDLLEKNASEQERADGFDIADYLIHNPLEVKREVGKILGVFIAKNQSLAKLIETFDLAIDKPESNSKI